MEFSRQEYWSGLPCPPPRDFPNPGIEPSSFVSYVSCISSRVFLPLSTTSKVPIGLGLSLIRLHSNLITSGKTLFPNKVTLTYSLASNDLEISFTWGIHLTTGLIVEAKAHMGISMGNQYFNIPFDAIQFNL